MNVLLVVESPNKAKKIRSYFPDFTVLATVGHFKDLPTDSMGVEPPDHKPQYIVQPDKTSVVTQLKKASRDADIIYIATDPDREGEAIAAHVANTIGKDCANKTSRIVYQEVSKQAIENAIKKRRAINWALVRAQEARRVIDRYVGYLVSETLKTKLGLSPKTPGFSAGRVQSVALKLVVERANEIAHFVPVEHFGVLAHLNRGGFEFTAQWAPKREAGELITDKSIALTVQARTDALRVSSVDTNQKVVAPPAPLITSSFVRLMAAALKLTTKQAMAAAQSLFERGLITYHRTDSPTMADDFVRAVRSFAAKQQLPLPQQPRTYKAKANAQEGHECLRVTDIELVDPRETGLDDLLLIGVYRLVWKVTLESQLADGMDQEVVVRFENKSKDPFTSRARTPKQLGWRQAAASFASNEETRQAVVDLAQEGESKVDAASEAVQTKLPAMQVGEICSVASAELITKHTAPPSPYTEKTLVERLDRLGIGRPSTYASTMERIITVGYVTRAKNLRLDPTPKGVVVSKSLDNVFNFMDYGYTADIEKAFDLIADNKKDYLTVVHSEWSSLTEEIKRFDQKALPADINLDDIKNASNYSTSQISKSDTEKAGKKSGVGAKAGNFSKKSPETIKVSPGNACPICAKGKLSVKKLAHGPSQGKSFLGCSNFPSCKFFQWH